MTTGHESKLLEDFIRYYPRVKQKPTRSDATKKPRVQQKQVQALWKEWPCLRLKDFVVLKERGKNGSSKAAGSSKHHAPGEAELDPKKAKPAPEEAEPDLDDGDSDEAELDPEELAEEPADIRLVLLMPWEKWIDIDCDAETMEEIYIPKSKLRKTPNRRQTASDTSGSETSTLAQTKHMLPQPPTQNKFWPGAHTGVGGELFSRGGRE